MQNNFLFIDFFSPFAILGLMHTVWGFLLMRHLKCCESSSPTDLIKALEIIEISGAWRALL